LDLSIGGNGGVRCHGVYGQRSLANGNAFEALDLAEIDYLFRR